MESLHVAFKGQIGSYTVRSYPSRQNIPYLRAPHEYAVIQTCSVQRLAITSALRCFRGLNFRRLGICLTADNLGNEC